MEIQKIGRRYYLAFAPFELREQIKGLGCKWDADKKNWWTSKQEIAEQCLALEAEETKDCLNALAIGKVQYKSRNYYLLWRGETKRGYGYKLAFSDGSSEFWAKAGEPLLVTKIYEKPRTIAALISYGKELKAARENGEPLCAECGKPGNLVEDWEDGLMKHLHCCDIRPGHYL